MIEPQQNRFDVRSLSGSNLYYYFDCRERSTGSAPGLRLAIIEKQVPRRMANWLLSVDSTNYVISTSERSQKLGSQDSSENSDDYTNRRMGRWSSGSSQKEMGNGWGTWRSNEFVLKVICHRREPDGTIKLKTIPVRKFTISVRQDSLGYAERFSCLNYGEGQKSIVMQYKKNYFSWSI